MTKLTLAEIQEKLNKLNDWSFDGKDINKEFKLTTYLEGLELAQKIGEIAESLDHHPLIEIDYRKVRVKIHTHSVDGVTELDFEFARSVDKLE
ncbi:MAG: 4a-hydroxytetrahydrobiopterin dehydratase [Leptospiraceae bacterium]|nr:4a-hydroxytetrahydrobiopterin dehydratase [Leptospiraceae bacterium]